MNSSQAYKIAEKLNGTTVSDHFGSEAFAANGRNFLTIWHETNSANVRLSLGDQKKFLDLGGDAFVEIDNAWGRQGWTKIQLEFVEKADLEKAIHAAYVYSATKTAVAKKKQPTKRTKKKWNLLTAEIVDLLIFKMGGKFAA